ncbi:MAG TPA: HipA family kinase, partial [Silvibacterium sp.]|nr:HipA family kinase [Silvibacterium sp.]
MPGRYNLTDASHRPSDPLCDPAARGRLSAGPSGSRRSWPLRLKFRGAGQGTLALLAELVAGEIGRALGLRVPELVFIEVDVALGRNEPDREIRHLLKASTGLNLALDYLPGSVMFNPAAADDAAAELASLAVWFDAFVTNVDRTPRNPNLLKWHREVYFIDQGAALYFHHNWKNVQE